VSGGHREARAYTVAGRVQGVGFRAFVRHHARDLGLAGWVRNEPDGTVAVEAAGDPERLDRLEEHLRSGPPASRVERVAVRPVDRTVGTDRFDVRF
jgi:acylphosphatase